MDWCTANIGIGALRETLHNDRTSNLPFTLKNPILSYPNSETDTFTNRGRVSSSVRLPSSLTTLLLSLVDSPAYGNLTTHFCTKIFNPATPDVKHVKYFSVAARTGRTSIFHPLWVPKLILTETEDAQRKTLTESSHDLKRFDWGNDGLVPVESAKWGEFLGIVEDCDHWDIRGAQGFSRAWERTGRSGKGGWSEFFRWQGARQSDQLAVDSGLEDLSQYENFSKESVSSVSHSQSPSENNLQGKTELKAAFKWIASRVPTQSSIRLPSPRSDQTRVSGHRFDLEHFYIALCRKLYEEGL